MSRGPQRLLGCPLALCGAPFLVSSCAQSEAGSGCRHLREEDRRPGDGFLNADEEGRRRTSLYCCVASRLPELPVQRSPVTVWPHVGSKCLAKGVLAPIRSSVTKRTQARALNTSADFVGHLEGTVIRDLQDMGPQNVFAACRSPHLANSKIRIE